eukprot:3514725-Amphidinium_carterae.1
MTPGERREFDREERRARRSRSASLQADSERPSAAQPAANESQGLSEQHSSTIFAPFDLTAVGRSQRPPAPPPVQSKPVATPTSARDVPPDDVFPDALDSICAAAQAPTS